MFKPSFTKTAVLLASVLMAGSVTAKEMKVGVVNVRAVFSQIPQTAKIQESLKTEFGDIVECRIVRPWPRHHWPAATDSAVAPHQSGDAVSFLPSRAAQKTHWLHLTGPPPRSV